MRHFYTARSKYKNRPKEYNGRFYHSYQEASDALWLDLLLSQKKIKEVKPQFRLVLSVNGKRVTTHIPDFLVTLNDGRQKIVETKGFATELWRIKMKLTQACYPQYDYLVNPTEKELLK
jgi:hypothetical protein